jgi:hypothetical protein
MAAGYMTIPCIVGGLNRCHILRVSVVSDGMLMDPIVTVDETLFMRRCLFIFTFREREPRETDFV